MHIVYTHSLLNLAASIAPDDDAGLFRNRESDALQGLICRLKLSRGNVVLISEPDILVASITGRPLAKREWVL